MWGEVRTQISNNPEILVPCFHIGTFFIFLKKIKDCLIPEYIYKENEYIFASYDYVLIDYPPTIQELAISFLLMSDLIIIPVNDGLGSFKGLIDLKNTLNYICQKEQRKIGKILITLNNIKSDNNTQQINNW